ncbi:hypothetical protein QE390_004365 [Siphonobacter sp. SORGH_AS 1065]|nr:hypothetical protein [Siphonobacter sp. SORGH_AS_1065]
MLLNFSDLYGHDSIIRSISVNRGNPGYDDSIGLEIDWYDTGLGKVTFYEVLKATFDLNFGMIVCESILSAECTEDDEGLELLKHRKKNFSIIKDLKCSIITTNSTGNQIKIYEKGFHL